MSCPNLSAPSGFYEIGAYKTNIKRLKEGVEELEELSKMAKERAELEAKYGKSLQQWTEKWSGHVDAKVPAGTIRDTWLQILQEGSEVSKLHVGLKERFCDEIVRTIALFKKENHHTRAFGGNSKEIHDIAEAFEKAQKQWKKLYDKVESAKKHYFSACRSERTAQVQVNNAAADSSVSPDASDKLRERLDKCKEEVRKARTSYENHLAECNKYRSVYMENMGFVFEKCQQMELKRIKFAMEMLSGIRCVLGDLVECEKLQELHRRQKQKFRTVGDVEFNADLKEWSRMHGIDAPCQWPLFEEYTPEMRMISAKQVRGTNGIVLTKRVSNSDELPTTPSVHRGSGTRPMSTISVTGATEQSMPMGLHREPSCGSSSQENSNTFDSKSSKSGASDESKRGALRNMNRLPASPFADPFPMRTPEVCATAAAKTERSLTDTPKRGGGGSAHSSDSGSFDEEARKDVPEEDDDALKYGDFGHQMRGPAKALYDYIPIEGDEIALTKGDLLEVISGPDHLGWCMGRKNDVTGLFPATYVAPV